MRMKNMEYLKIDQLKDGYLYKIMARNAGYGIWSSDREGFIISRIKFGDNFVFVEHHWDSKEWPTAKPIEEIEKSPFDKEELNHPIDTKVSKRILKYLNNVRELYNS